jgi:hypothetical protein
MLDKQIEEALAECHTYNRMGALDETVMRDIAHDNGVSFEMLKNAYEGV